MKVNSFTIFLAVLLYLGIDKHVFAQTATDNLILEARGSYSVFMAHRHNLKAYPNAHFGMYELNLAKKVSGKYRWHLLYHYPIVGASLYFTNMGKNKYTGSAFATFAYIQFPYLRFKKSSVNFKLALGPGWVEKKFDRVANYKNVVTGTHLNAAIQLTQSYQWQIGAHQNLAFGICLTHFSNGAYKLPNLGINMAGIQLTYQYQFKEVKKALTDTITFSKKMKYQVAYSAGLKQVYPVLGKQYFLQNLSLIVFNQYKEKGSVGLLFDLFKDDSVINQMMYDTDSTNNGKTNVQLGIGGVYEFAIDRFTIPLAAGIYVYNNYRELPLMYLKFGLNYYITKKIHLSFNLKSHYAKADYFSYGVGYRF
jgi:hypothetical protein